MQLVIKVEIKPFLKKYIAKDYQVNPFVLTVNNNYGIFLLNALQRPTQKIVHKFERIDKLDDAVYTDTLPVIMSEDFWLRYGCILTEERKYHFNKFVTHQFNEEFYKYVRNRAGKKGSVDQAISTFLKNYNITEDELSFQSIRRAYQRRNQRVNALLSA